MTGTDVVAEARGWIGTPFRHQGRRKGSGVDCVGLVVGVAESLGIPIRDRSGYSEHFHVDEVALAALENELESIRQWRPGDILLLTLGSPFHLAIAADWNTIIHVWGRRGTVQHSLPRDWRIRGSYRYRGID